jgi:hypothetical protein
VFRSVDRDDSRVLAVNEKENKFIDDLICSLKAEYSEEKIGSMVRENRILREKCREYKRQFFAENDAPYLKSIGLSDERQLESMKVKIQELSEQCIADRREARILIAKIDRQIRDLVSCKMSLPPPPLCFDRIANTRTSRLAGVSSISRSP